MFTEKIKQFIDRFISSEIKGKLIFSISIDNFKKKHDLNRRVKGLFKNAMKTYKIIEEYKKPNIICNIGITITHHNYKNVIELYDYLKKQGIKSFTATIMREEGIVKNIKSETKKKILKAYSELTKKIHNDQIKNKTKGFGNNIQAKLMNSKNFIMNNLIKKIYLKNRFVSYCSAGCLFGVIYANGDIYPCEILTNHKLGNLRDYDMDFMKLWKNKKAQNCRNFIKKTKCSCTFECAWTLNIISDFKFFPKLLINSMRF